MVQLPFKQLLPCTDVPTCGTSTALASARSNCTSKLQTCLLVREGATKWQSRNSLKEISRRKKNWSRVPDGRLTPGQTGQLTVGRKLTSTFWKISQNNSKSLVSFEYHLLGCYRRADNSRPVSFTVSVWEWVYATNLTRLQRETRERERKEKTARRRCTQCTNKSDPITSTSELLLRQNSVTAHAHQS
jgi:hypothetical protein